MTTNNETAKVADEKANTTEADDKSVAVAKDKRVMDDNAFKRTLKDFKNHLSATKRTAHHLAVAAAQHFKDHGDTSRLQQLLDCFENEGKNFVRVAAYKLWMRDTLPITMDADTGKLIKRPGSEFDEDKFEQGMNKPFWNWAPDKEDIIWDENDVLKMLRKGVSTLENDRHKPKDANATAKLEEVKNFLHKMEEAA